ncbi:hypothetical protein [Tupaia glis polyomavirus 1]|uniref:Uncharacterized protein n=1 Tax=Tupaia glis polyomavirus 1 TaxID=2170402 RepID=A0A2S1CJR4_9POLY|nr:hypothetical protein [Tupaia glis polyomavirus 1]AWD33798.1 hypothetical protein [Tupaia glis polyomavirus 1]AWD33807.1 hypothetical protein [Tupaia glis polyomavirus 1]AWD33816.1 hypothetical protein [Tupaia glis polyomavirus 1]
MSQASCQLLAGRHLCSSSVLALSRHLIPWLAACPVPAVISSRTKEVATTPVTSHTKVSY